MIIGLITFTMDAVIDGVTIVDHGDGLIVVDHYDDKPIFIFAALSLCLYLYLYLLWFLSWIVIL